MWRNGKFGILVVDDEPAVLATYELILKKRDFAVHVAESSSRAIQLLGEYTYDLLLCDYSLEQEHTGFEVIHAARRVHPDIAAVLLTGYASKETVDRAQADNVTVLFKPIDIEEFFRTVESLKRGKDAQASQQKTDQGKRQERKRPKGKARAAANRRGDSN